RGGVVSRYRHAGAFVGRHRSRKVGASLDFSDYRNYSPGDDPRLLDWALYARTNRLYLKVFEAEDDLAVHLLLDGSASMWEARIPPAEGKPPAKIVTALRLSAAVGYVALSDLDRVSAHVFCEGIVSSSDLLRGPGQFRSLVDFLSHVPSTPTQTKLLPAARQLMKRLRGGGVCVVVSDFLVRDWPTALRMLASRFELRLIILRSAWDEEPIRPGEYELIDSESEDSLRLVVTSELLASYRKLLDDHHGQIVSFASRRGFAVLTLRENEELDGALLRRMIDAGILR
ncbi:MAG: DUF58 domain-containing protein, partial [Verrucomicrobiia bacterium]